MSVFEKWSPVTSDFGLIQSSVEQAADAYQKWFAESGTNLLRKKLAGRLEESFDALLPLTNAKNRRVFNPTNCGWVAFFQNGILGSDPSFNMMKLAQRLGVYTMRICRSPPEARYPSLIWEVFAPEKLGGTKYGRRRSIAASNDGGRWVFEVSGVPFDFERLEQYTARLKRDRFTADLLEEYLRHFGIPKIGDDLFRNTNAHPSVFFEQEGPSSLPEFTLNEVLEGKPWKQ